MRSIRTLLFGMMMIFVFAGCQESGSDPSSKITENGQASPIKAEQEQPDLVEQPPEFQSEVDDKINTMIQAKNCGSYGIWELGFADEVYKKTRSELLIMIDERKAAKNYLDEQSNKVQKSIDFYAQHTSAQLVAECNRIKFEIMAKSQQ